MGERRWCILRTSGRKTLALARTLAADGFDVWTPTTTHHVTVPRINARRDVILPMMPSFVFARADRLLDLIELANSVPMRRGPARRQSAHDDFTVFHYRDRIPLVLDSDLEPLRTSERKAVPPSKWQQFKKGEKVRVPEGAFEGMAGVVEGTRGKFTLVCFGTGKAVKISTFILLPDAVRDGHPSEGMAARAA